MEHSIKTSFNEFVKTKKHKGNPISEQSIKIYISQFNSLLKSFKTDKPNFVNNPERVLQVLENEFKNTNTLKLKLNIILMILECFFSDNKNYDKNVKIYNDHLTKLITIIKDNNESHIPSETQINKALDQQENELIITTLKKNVKHSIQDNEDLEHLKQYIIYLFYEYHPIRADIATSKFILSKDIHKMNEKVNNVVLDKDNKEGYYFQVDYKTKKAYGENKIKITNELYKYIVKLFNYYNNKLKIKDKYFLYQKDNITPFNTNNLSKFYSNIGLLVLNKPISLQINRIQQASEDSEEIDRLEEKSKQQNHSITIHTTTYYKRGLKSKKQ
jgi:hypothetical protein